MGEKATELSNNAGIPAVRSGRIVFPISTRRILPWVAVVGLATVGPSVASAEETFVHECDRLAADRHDSAAVAPGVGLEDIDTAHAIAACVDAVSEHPDLPRLRYQLGRAYHAAEKWAETLANYRAAAKAGSVRSRILLGHMLVRREAASVDDREGITWLRLSAEAGDLSGQYELAVALWKGFGSTKDMVEAVYWFEKAAAAGMASAKAFLAEALLEGLGTRRNVERGIELLQEAAAQDDARGMELLSLAHRKGLGVPRDTEKADFYFSRAAKAYLPAAHRGDAHAQYIVGMGFAKGDGGKPDNDTAHIWIRRSAENGHSDAKFALGSILVYDPATPADRSRGFALLHEGAASGSAAALKRLYRMYVPRRGPDGSEYYEQLQRMADADDSVAQHFLGEMYRMTAGNAEDVGVSIAWFHKAAEAGFAPAREKLMGMYGFDPHVVEFISDEQKARILEWTHRWADAGAPDALGHLAAIYSGGLGVPKDEQKALEFYRRAAAGGYSAVPWSRAFEPAEE